MDSPPCPSRRQGRERCLHLAQPDPIIRYNDDGTIKLTAAYVIDRDRLLLEWALVVLVTLGLVFVVTPKEQKSLSITREQPPLSIR